MLGCSLHSSTATLFQLNPHMGNHILRTHLWNASDGADPEYELELLIEQIKLFMGAQPKSTEQADSCCNYHEVLK